MRSDNDVTHFARTNFRDDRRLFGIKRRDRRAHMYIVGKTGTGKSTLLKRLIDGDLKSEGLAVLDPHGDLIEDLLTKIPARRRNDIIYFNVPDANHPLSFNPLGNVPATKRPLVAAQLLEVFAKLWTGPSWGVRLEHILRNSLLTLLDQPEATLGDILPLLDDKHYRRVAISHISNPQVRRFWTHEYAAYPPRYRIDVASPIQNKVGAFLTNPILNRILTQPKSDINLRDVMDQGKILLVNLAKGKIGEDPAALLGALLVSQIGSAGLSRADSPEEQRRDFYVYLDEFQTFTTLSLATMLSELRKYRVNLILANQYLSQIETPVLDAVLGNMGTLISFRVGPSDADFLAKEFSPQFGRHDLVNLPNYSVYLRLMIDGAVSQAFSATTEYTYIP